jgi:hypothetical protein
LFAREWQISKEVKKMGKIVVFATKKGDEKQRCETQHQSRSTKSQGSKIYNTG